MKDESKAIIDEINSLKTEFESLRRDEGSLNLSSTLQNPNIPSIENRGSFNPNAVHNPHIESPEDMIFKQYVREIK